MAQSNLSHGQRFFRSVILAMALVAFGAAVGFCHDPSGSGEGNANAENATSVEYDPAHSPTLKVAINESKATGKPIMLLFTGSDWCVWCIKLNNEILQQPEFAEWSRKKIIFVEVDFPQHKSQTAEIAKRNDALKNKFKDQVNSYPTILFVDYKGNVLAKTGYLNANASSWIANAESILPTMPPEKIESKVEDQVADRD